MGSKWSCSNSSVWSYWQESILENWQKAVLCHIERWYHCDVRCIWTFTWQRKRWAMLEFCFYHLKISLSVHAAMACIFTVHYQTLQGSLCLHNEDLVVPSVLVTDPRTLIWHKKQLLPQIYQTSIQNKEWVLKSDTKFCSRTDSLHANAIWIHTHFESLMHSINGNSANSKFCK